MNTTNIIDQQETPSFDPIGAAKDKAWQAIGSIAKSLAETKPSVGKQVNVVGGRKHKGKSGVVFWHGQDHYIRIGQYCNDMQLAMRLARGKFGFRCGIQTPSGEKFFVSAEYVEVIV